MQDIPMRKTFETTSMKILIEEVSYTNSAFAINEDGEGVFLNGRMVDRLSLEGGEVLMAKCIPNYEDKRDSIPWRCVRANKFIEEENSDDLTAKIKKLLNEEGGPLPALEIAQELGLSLETVDLCLADNKNFDSVPAYLWVGD
tara:strand:+ start:1019 stop:1447 length:429 start_codon:yes stop_codon:yes gene_type:complete